MARMSYSEVLALVLLTLVCGFSKAEDEPVEFDRKAVLVKLDEAAAKTDNPELKGALKKMRQCVERSHRLLVLSGLRTLPPERSYCFPVLCMLPTKYPARITARPRTTTLSQSRFFIIVTFEHRILPGTVLE